MRSVVGRLACLLAVLLTAAIARAQPLQDSSNPFPELPTVESGKLAPPEHVVPGTLLRLFDEKLATRMGEALSRMRRAVVDCRHADWTRASLNWLESANRRGWDAEVDRFGDNPGVTARARANHDSRTLWAFAESPGYPIYIYNCPPLPMRPLENTDGLPTLDSTKLGLPESLVDGTEIAVFDTQFAMDIADALARMRNAARTCNSHGFVEGYGRLYKAKQARESQVAEGGGRDLVARGQAAYDAVFIDNYVQRNWIRFPIPCTPERDRR